MWIEHWHSFRSSYVLLIDRMPCFSLLKVTTYWNFIVSFTLKFFLSNNDVGLKYVIFYTNCFEYKISILYWLFYINCFILKTIA